MYHAVTPEEWDVMHELHGALRMGMLGYACMTGDGLRYKREELISFWSRSLAISSPPLLQDEGRLRCCFRTRYPQLAWRGCKKPDAVYVHSISLQQDGYLYNGASYGPCFQISQSW